MKIRKSVALLVTLLVLLPILLTACNNTGEDSTTPDQTTDSVPGDSKDEPTGDEPTQDDSSENPPETPEDSQDSGNDSSELPPTEEPDSSSDTTGKPPVSSDTDSETVAPTEQPPVTTPEPPVTTPEDTTYDPALDDSSIPEYPNNGALNQRPSYSDTWVAIDGLGRVLPTNKETGDRRDDKYVGLFYWSWHGDFAKVETAYNIQQILDANPGLDKNDVNSPLWGPVGKYHFWNESIYGYYDNAKDKWVVRKQAELLADAGVDVIFFDNTNGRFLWYDSVINIAEVFLEARQDGVKTPQLAFLLPFSPSDDATWQLKRLYSTVYQNSKYDDLWFQWDGKPLIMAFSSQLNRNDPTEKAIYDFFTFRQPEPGYLSKQTTARQWGWLSVYPQAIYKDTKNRPEQITVGVAMNHSAKYNQISAMNGDTVMGRTYTSKGYDTRANAKLYGANFAEQFDYALKVDPKFIFITGWNEWVAGRQNRWPGGEYASSVTNAFPDQFNDEFSRDIEPSKGALKDHYYYQMVSYIRKFKGTAPMPESSGKKTIDITKGFGQWANVYPTYIAYEGNTGDRNSTGYINPSTGKNYVYKDSSGRNDIYDAKVTHDSNNIYFMVRTVDKITPYNGGNWMNLYLDTTSRTSSNNWESFEYVLNRSTPTATKAKLEKSKGGWNWQVVGEVDYTVQGNVMMVKIPKSMLGITGDTFTINFKWTDNVKFQTPGDIMDFYTSGDVAPGGRFKYQYNAKP